MNPSWWPGKQHEQFTLWALSQGVEVDGVSPARFSGRGLGMIATRNIKEGEIMVTVPLQAMLTTDSIPASFVRKFQSTENMSVHGLLAAFFTHGDPEDLQKYELWMNSWPTRRDFESTMPLLWPRNLRVSNSKRGDGDGDGDGDEADDFQTVLLPPSISGRWNTLRSEGSSMQKWEQQEYESFHQNLLAQQEKRLRDAWDSVSAVFPESDWNTFSYYWLVVNTRCFYFVPPGEEPPEDANDAMALLPFADYFNHSDVACNVNFDGSKYIFQAAKSYEKGEEVFMNYGSHPNDFLFTEYGFFLDENSSEAVYLDGIIFHDLGPSDREDLKSCHYYGNYRCTSSGVCYRTEIAAAMKYMTRRDWRNYVLGRSMRGVDAAKSKIVIQGWIRAYIGEADTVVTALLTLKPSLENDDKGKAEILLKRWGQIKHLCYQALDAVNC